MKRCGLVLVTLFTLLVTGLTLAQVGWLTSSRGTLPVSSRRGGMHSHVKASDPFGSEAGRRYRRCQSTHWRGLMLQR